jgi:hypothetical protein
VNTDLPWLKGEWPVRSSPRRAGVAAALVQRPLFETSRAPRPRARPFPRMPQKSSATQRDRLPFRRTPRARGEHRG